MRNYDSDKLSHYFPLYLKQLSYYTFYIGGILLILLILLLISIVFLLYKANKNTKDVAINNISLSETEIKFANQQLNILHLSDLHLENISISPQMLQKMIEKQQIDLISGNNRGFFRSQTKHP